MKRVNKEILLAVVILFLLSLLSLTWFDGDHVLGVGDNYNFTNMSVFLKSLNSSWDGMRNTGFTDHALGTLFPLGILYFPLGYIGVNEVVIQKIWIFLTLFLPGLFAYFFVTEFWGKRVHNLIRLASAILYVFNPLTMLSPIGLSTTKFPVYMLLPLLSYLMMKIFSAKTWKSKITLALIFSLCTILLSSSVVNIAEVTPLFIFLTMLFSFLILNSDNKLKHFGLFVGAFILSCLLNFWFIFGSTYSQFLNKETYANIVVNFVVGGAKVFDAVRLFGFWALNESYGQLPYFSFGSFYYSFAGVVLTFIIPLLVFSSFVIYHFYSFAKEKTLFVFSVLLFGIFLVKGMSPPLGGWYKSLYESTPLFRMFREPYAKFSLLTLIAFVLLSAYTLTFFLELVSKKLNNTIVNIILSVTFIFISLAVSFPMVNGNVISKVVYRQTKSVQVKVPDYWLELDSFTKSTKLDGRVLTLPQNWYYAKSYLWESGYIGFPFELFMNADFIYRREVSAQNAGDELIKVLYNSISLYNETHEQKYLNVFTNLSRLLNVKYILRMNDFDVLSYGDAFKLWTPDVLDGFTTDLATFATEMRSFGSLSEAYLNNIPQIGGGDYVYRFETDPTPDDYINILRDRAALILYKVDDAVALDKFYIPTKVYTYKDPNEMLAELESPDVINEKPMFVSGNFDLPYDYNNLQVKFDEVSESKYKVTVLGESSSLFPLVFSESYSDGWKLASECSLLGCSYIEDVPHFAVSFYANGYLIDLSKVGHTFYVVHESNARLSRGIVVSALALTFTIGSFLFINLKSKK